MQSFSLELLSPRLWFWVVLLLPALCLAFWTYFRLLAPLSRPARWTLWLLRGAAFFLVLFALWQPVATVAWKDSGKPALAVLIDRSGSTSLPGRGAGTTRAEEISSLLPRIEESLSDRYRVQWYGFNTTLQSMQPDSALRPDGPTAIGGALEDVVLRASSGSIAGIVLVSDGVSTVGRDPLRVASVSPVPIFTVPVGPSRPPQDLQVRRVETNPTAWKGERLPFRISLESTGLAGRRARVVLREQGVEVESLELELLGGAGVEQDVTLETRPHGAGLTLYEIEATVNGDSVLANNRRAVAVRVLERKTKVLVAADGLDWDFAFLRRALAADTTLDYRFFVAEKPGAFRSGGSPDRLPATAAELSEHAAVILLWTTGHGFPSGFISSLGPFVRQGGGLFVLGGPAAGEVVPPELARILPATAGAGPLSGRERASALTLTSEGLRHPALALREDPGEAARAVSSLPPIWRGTTLAPKAGARVLADFSTKSGAASAIVAGYHERGRVLWFSARGLWRWQLTASGAGLPSDLLGQFALGLARWLAEPVDRERFQVHPTRRVYQSGESVAFEATLWDEGYQPVSGASVQLEVSPLDGAATPLSVPLSGSGEAGGYEGTRPSLPPGAYRYRATARAVEGGAPLGTTEGRFWVETMGPEFARPWADHQTMQEIAKRSGGLSIEMASLRDLAGKIPRTLRSVGRIREIEIWNHWLLFVLFVALLSTEWFLRRRRGLA